MQRALNAKTEEELRRWAVEEGFPAFRGSQLFTFFHQTRGIDPMEAHVLPKAVRECAVQEAIRSVEAMNVLRSADGSAKYLYGLSDGAVIETVYMPYHDRTTLCVSSQVGCKMGCTFCASTKAPFGRSLQAEEILAQVYETDKAQGHSIDHIVMMGIGEPLDNLDEVLRFIALISDPKGKNLGLRHITISTSGLVPGIRRLAEMKKPINLAISLHATSDERRQRTMPVARKYSIRELLQAAAYYFEMTTRRVSFEYALIAGENDRPEDIAWMARNLRGAGMHVNLIPLNEIEEFDAKSAGENEVVAFARALEKEGVHVSVRQKRGADIDAACGQLHALYEGIGGVL